MRTLLLQRLSNVLYIFVADRGFGLQNTNSAVFRVWCLPVVEIYWSWCVYRPIEGATEDHGKTKWGTGYSGIDNSTDRRDQNKDSIVDPEMSIIESKFQNNNVNSFRTLSFLILYDVELVIQWFVFTGNSAV